jgi:hypothetical protein
MVRTLVRSPPKPICSLLSLWSCPNVSCFTLQEQSFTSTSRCTVRTNLSSIAVNCGIQAYSLFRSLLFPTELFVPHLSGLSPPSHNALSLDYSFRSRPSLLAYLPSQGPLRPARPSQLCQGRLRQFISVSTSFLSPRLALTYLQLLSLCPTSLFLLLRIDFGSTTQTDTNRTS